MWRITVSWLVLLFVLRDCRRINSQGTQHIVYSIRILHQIAGPEGVEREMQPLVGVYQNQNDLSYTIFPIHNLSSTIHTIFHNLYYPFDAIGTVLYLHIHHCRIAHHLLGHIHKHGIAQNRVKVQSSSSTRRRGSARIRSITSTTIWLLRCICGRSSLSSGTPK